MILAARSVQADDGFVVEDIQVRGLQRISVGTVYNYLPVNVGDKFTEEKQGIAIRALFNTGFFKDISLEREGYTLVINVQERPSISKVVIEGNKDIKKEDLNEALKKIGLGEGKVYNKQMVEKVEQELRRQYFSHGKYGLKIKTEVTELSRNRVAIHVEISEGKVAKIKQINIVGNQVFATEAIKKEFELNTTNFLSFYTKDDQYSKQKLSADLEKLRSYYLDRGYINFAIESTQVDISADKKEIYITINVKEGDVYTLEKVKLSGEMIVPPEELVKLVKVGPNEIFSRKNATETSKAISDRLGNEGYTFANVNMVPEINDAQKSVTMTFFIDPGKRVYVRRINVKGNTKTRDEVIRREMRQMESSWAASNKIERSKTRLERLGYFEEVSLETPPVVGSADQIDVNFSVKEKASGNLQAGVGYSQVQGIIFNANISQDNIFGTGKRVDLNFNNSQIMTRYNIGFTDPYYTLDGIRVGYNLGYATRNSYAANLASYNSRVANASISFGLPLSESNSIGTDFELKDTGISTNYLTSQTIQTELANYHRTSFRTLSSSFGWTHDTLDKPTFSHQGGQQRISSLGTVPGSDLEYYKLTYKHQHYFPLSKDFTFRLLGEVDHGGVFGKTSQYPFFENYYGGGPNDVRGFMQNTLGPRDSNGRPFGSSNKIIAKAELFFPIPFLSELKSARLGTFLDAGSLGTSLRTLNEWHRFSVGLSGEWLSPFGALAVSLAHPLNAQPGDYSQTFQFTFGSGF